MRKQSRQYPGLAVKAGNMVDGYINGQQCRVLVDSATSNTLMFFTQAKNLGLITGNEETVAELNNTWAGCRELQVIWLQEVEITLEGGVLIRTPVKVYPKDMEKGYSETLDAVYLGMDVLHRGHVVQKFCACGRSNIAVRRAERLRRRPRQQKLPRYPSFYVRKQGEDTLREVLVDTGASLQFYVTKQHHYVNKAGRSVRPRNATLDLGGGHCLDADHVKGLPNQSNNFILGRELLHKYNAVLDCGNDFVAFKVGDKYVRVFFDME